MPPARRRVSYVIPPPGDNVPRLQLPPHALPRNGATGPLLVQARGKPDASNHHLSKGPQHPRHRLGVACLALDTSTQLVGRSNPDGILYSGGRDGLVLSWDLGIKMKRRSQRYGVTTNAMQRNIGRWEIMTGWNDIIEEDPDEGEEPTRDGDVLGEVKGAGARGRRRVDPSIPFEHQWETDIDAFEEGKVSHYAMIPIEKNLLSFVASDQFDSSVVPVVTASSDGTVKAWSPHTQSEPTTIGSHADYVRCLAHCYNQSWVASGSFDRTIKLWDLGNPPSSNKSPLITLTAPESSGPKASVYALATDPYGSVVVSGSPERVIRMWDPRSGKRVGKLVGHTDNIRAILLSDDSRYIFYSGDRSGLVCKVDVENCTDVAEGECIVICQDSGTCNNTSNNNCGPNVNGGAPGNAESTAGFIPCNEGVNKIVAMDDNLLWTASGSSCIRRWKVPARRAARAPHYSSSMVGLGLGGGGSIIGHNEVESPTQSESGNSPVDLHPSHFPSSTSTSTNAPVLATTTSTTLSPPSPPFGRRSLELGNRSRTPPLGVTFRSSSPSHPSQPTGIPRRGHRTSFTASVAGSDHYSIIQDHDQDNEREEKTSYGIPYDSLVRLTSPNEGLYPQPMVGFMTSASLVGLGPVPGTATSGNFGYSGTMGMGAGGRGRDPEIATLYSAASVMSVPRVVRSPLQAIFPNMNQPRPTSPFYPSAIRVGSGEGETLHPLKTPQMLYEEREVAADATPLYSEPDDIIDGEHGLVRSIILNDRIHVLTVDTRGEVAVWNIVRGVCLGKYKAEDVSDATFYGSSKGSSNGSANANSGSGERGTSPREALETVRERIEGEAVVISWCSVDTKTGVLTVHLNERCFDAEIYADEAGYADRQFSDELRLNIGKWVLRSVFINFIREETRSASRRHRSTTSTSSSSSHHHDSHHHHIHRSAAPAHIDIRGHSPETRRRSSSDVSGSSLPTPPRSASIVTSPNMLPAVAPIITNLGKSPSPLHTPSIPISALSRNGESLSSQLTPIPQSPFLDDAMTPMPLTQIAEGVPATPATKENDYFTQRARKPSVSAASTGAPATPDDFSGWGGPGSKSASTAVASIPDSNVPQTPSTPGGRFMGRLMSFGRGGKGRQDSEPEAVASVPGQSSGEGAATREEPIFPKTPLQVMLSGPLNPPPSSEAPSIPIPINTSIVISEEAPSGWKTIYRGHVSSTGHDKALLEEAMPLWLLEYLLINKAPSVPINKVSFVLLPCKDTNGEQLPELLNTQQAKLTASRFLRVRKLTHHVQDKLDKIAGKTQGGTPRSSYDRSAGSTTGSKPERTKPEDSFEILCNDSVLPLDMTLAAVRQYVWRQSGELVMQYRRRLGPPLVPSRSRSNSRTTSR